MPEIASWNAGLLLRRNISEYWSYKTYASYTLLSASDIHARSLWVNSRNLSFSSEVVELSYQTELNFFAYDKTKSEKRFTPYWLSGFGVFYFNPKAELNGNLYSLRLLGTEGQGSAEEDKIKYNPIQMFFIFGGGFKWSFNKHWSINLEMALRKTNTDYLDDIGGVYPDEDLVLRYDPKDGEIILALSDRSQDNLLGVDNKQRSSSKKKDNYLIFGIHLTYTINRQTCPMVYN